MSVYRNIEFGLKARKVPESRRKILIEDILDKVQMCEFKDAYPNNLSGGQQQRVALARALAGRPKILLMDEPLSNLDYDLNRMMREEILRLHRALGTSFLYVTHDREEAFSLATRIVVMNRGKIMMEGGAEEVSEYFHGLNRECW